MRTCTQTYIHKFMHNRVKMTRMRKLHTQIHARMHADIHKFMHNRVKMTRMRKSKSFW